MVLVGGESRQAVLEKVIAESSGGVAVVGDEKWVMFQGLDLSRLGMYRGSAGVFRHGGT